jgi:hypothetical protein
MGRRRTWKRCPGERGTIAEQLLLNRSGFVVMDLKSDVHYVGPGDVIRLCPKNHWYADKAPDEYTSIEEYLSYVQLSK